MKLLTITLIALMAVSCSHQDKQNAHPAVAQDTTQLNSMDFLVGTWTKDGSKGIYKLTFHPADGTLNSPTLVYEQDSPSYLYISKDGEHIYSANENDPGTLSSYRWNEDHSALIQTSQKPSMGAAPCYIEVDEQQKLLAAANYGSGDVVLYKLNEHGELTGEAQYRKHEGHGPVSPNQESAHAHCVRFSPDGKFLYAVDLGTDRVLVYPIDGEGNLGQGQTALQLDPGDGPRHLIFHPEKDLAFLSEELANSVVVARRDSETGLLERLDKKSTLPDGFTGENAVADIHLSADNRFLYVSNRGMNTIALFSVEDNGSLEMQDQVSVEGDWPRNFCLTPDGTELLVANQRSNDITSFRVNRETGQIKFTGKKATIQTPVFVRPLPGN